jgi:predicted Holliday junction resolvase-like endonuclease
MSRLRLFNPLVAINDLRRFLASRQKHELIFAFLAVFVTVGIIVAFYADSGSLKRPYQRQIQYVESWPADRSDEEIIAAQKADAANRAQREAAEKKRRDEHRAALQRLDDALTRLGI